MFTLEEYIDELIIQDHHGLGMIIIPPFICERLEQRLSIIYVNDRKVLEFSSPVDLEAVSHNGAGNVVLTFDLADNGCSVGQSFLWRIEKNHITIPSTNTLFLDLKEDDSSI